MPPVSTSSCDEVQDLITRLFTAFRTEVDGTGFHTQLARASLVQLNQACWLIEQHHTAVYLRPIEEESLRHGIINELANRASTINYDEDIWEDEPIEADNSMGNPSFDDEPIELGQEDDDCYMHSDQEAIGVPNNLLENCTPFLRIRQRADNLRTGFYLNSDGVTAVEHETAAACEGLMHYQIRQMMLYMVVTQGMGRGMGRVSAEEDMSWVGFLQDERARRPVVYTEDPVVTPEKIAEVTRYFMQGYPDRLLSNIEHQLLLMEAISRQDLAWFSTWTTLHSLLNNLRNVEVLSNETTAMMHAATILQRVVTAMASYDTVAQNDPRVGNAIQGTSADPRMNIHTGVASEYRDVTTATTNATNTASIMVPLPRVYQPLKRLMLGPSNEQLLALCLEQGRVIEMEVDTRPENSSNEVMIKFSLPHYMVPTVALPVVPDSLIRNAGVDKVARRLGRVEKLVDT